MTDMELYDALVALLDAQFEALLLRARVPEEFISPAPAARAARTTQIVKWARQGDANRAQIEAALKRVLRQQEDAERPELHEWEADYLRDRLAAWEQGRFGAFAQAARSQHVERARLYVSLKAAPQPWCYLDKKGRLVVATAEAPGGPRKSRKRPADSEAAFARGDHERGAPYTEHALARAELPCVVVQGEAGSGKTVLLQHMAYVLARCHLGQALPDHRLDLEGLRRRAPLLRIPVFVEARAVAVSPSGLEGGLLDAVRDAVGRVHPIEASMLAAGLRAGRYLVLIDALDEVPTIAGRQHVLQCLSGLAALGWRSRAVLTTRPTAHTGAQLPAGLRVLPLAPLDDESIERLVERWCAAHGATASEQAALHAAVRGVRERHAADNIVTNPLLLSCLMLVYDQQRLLPDSTSELYERMVGILCDLRQALRASSRFSADDRREALTLVFHGMQRTGGTERPVAEIAEELREWRRDDLPTRDAAERFLDELGNDTALLRFEERREAGGRLVRLAKPWHRSFQEYLTACSLATTDSVVDETDRLFEAQEGRPAVVEDPSWEGTLTFLVGTLGRRRARTYVERLAARVRGVEGLSVPQREGRVLGLAATGMVEYSGHFQGHELHQTLPGEIVERFEERGAAWPWRDRVLALEALGRLGDPRLKRDPWVEIAGGVFVMGGDEAVYAVPAHEVTVALFRLSRWPVTVAEYREFVEAGGYAEGRWWVVDPPSEGEPEGWRQQLRHPNRPVVGVSWHEALAWCRWATEHRGPAGWYITLATEEEWEFAARGVEERKFPWGSAEPGEEDGARANYAWRNAPNTGPWRPTPVGAFPQGDCGELWDMSGNVWEWTSSVWRDPKTPVAEWPRTGCREGDRDCREGDEGCRDDDKPCREGDKEGVAHRFQSEEEFETTSAARRVLRGGSWLNDARDLRCAARYWCDPGHQLQLIGFRVVCRRFRQHVTIGS